MSSLNNKFFPSTPSNATSKGKYDSTFLLVLIVPVSKTSPVFYLLKTIFVPPLDKSLYFSFFFDFFEVCDITSPTDIVPELVNCAGILLVVSDMDFSNGGS